MYHYKLSFIKFSFLLVIYSWSINEARSQASSDAILRFETERNSSSCNANDGNCYICDKFFANNPDGVDTWGGISESDEPNIGVLINQFCGPSSLLNSTSARIQQVNLANNLFGRRKSKNRSPIGGLFEFSENVYGINVPFTFHQKLGKTKLTVPSIIGVGTSDSSNQILGSFQPYLHLKSLNRTLNKKKLIKKAKFNFVVNIPIVLRYTTFSAENLDSQLEGQLGGSFASILNIYRGETTFGFGLITDMRYNLGNEVELPISLIGRVEYKKVITQAALSSDLYTSEGASGYGNIGYRFGKWIFGYSLFINEVFGHGLGVTYDRSILSRHSKKNKK
jgi:hypothetical protein